MPAKQTFPFARSTANDKFPYDPFTKQGDPDDGTQFIQPPGVVFFRPWLSVPNGPSFIWPIGLEGFDLDIDPTLGLHKYIGGNAVVVNVIHRGDETISMSGNFPGSSSADALKQLREVVYAVTPPAGKILYLPGVLPYAQRVVVSHAGFSRDGDARGDDLTYNITFERTGLAQKYPAPVLATPGAQPKAAAKGGSSRVFVVTASLNTLRKIAQNKLKSASKWESIYDKNVKLFNRLKVTKHNAPNYKLKIGTKIYL